MRITGSLALLCASAALAACSVGGASDTTDDDVAGEQPTTVVVATHDSWNAPKPLIKEFERTSGYTVEIVPNGDAGQLVNKLVLTKDAPIADAVYGVDNTFASRVVDAGVVADYRSADLPRGEFDLEGKGAEQLTPIDWSDVCFNVDDAYFAERGLTRPQTLADLTKPAYRDLTVVPGAPTSSPGFAFLLSTIAEFGEEGWADYWTQLVRNGVRITSGWSDAYFTDFTAGGGNGDRPIVLSYSSSIPFTVPEGKTEPTTSALLETCFRQVEYAAVLSGAANAQGAQEFIDFMVAQEFQEALPDSMYVYPVLAQAKLPEAWAKFATPAEEPYTVPADEIAENRQDWLTQWSEITRG